VFENSGAAHVWFTANGPQTDATGNAHAWFDTHKTDAPNWEFQWAS
jgi:hypothetical protein